MHLNIFGSLLISEWWQPWSCYPVTWVERWQPVCNFCQSIISVGWWWSTMCRLDWGNKLGWMLLDELQSLCWTISNCFLLSPLECVFCSWHCWEPAKNCLYTSFFFFASAPSDCPDSVPSSTETGRTNCLAPGGLSGKTSLFFPWSWMWVELTKSPNRRRSDAEEFWGCALLRKACLKGKLGFISVAVAYLSCRGCVEIPGEVLHPWKPIFSLNSSLTLH